EYLNAVRSCIQNNCTSVKIPWHLEMDSLSLVYVNTFPLKRFQYILIVLGLALTVSCANKKEGSQERTVEVDSTAVSYRALPPIVSVSEEKMGTINQWKKFNELNILMERFQQQE